MSDHHLTRLSSDTVVRQEDGSPYPVSVSANTVSVPRNGTGVVNVSLPVKPSANVTVKTVLVWSGAGGLTVSGGATLTFTPANYSTPQTVTFSYTSSTAQDGHAYALLTASGNDAPGFAPVQILVEAVGN